MKTCTNCGEKNLDWIQMEGRWKLYDANGNFHKCTGVYTPNFRSSATACRHGILKINFCDMCEEERNKE